MFKNLPKFDFLNELLVNIFPDIYPTFEYFR